MDKAKEIILLRDREKAKQRGFWWSLWQDAADLCYPREDQIVIRSNQGEDKSTKRMDDTAVFDSQEMASGLSGSLIPTGQRFFGLRIKNKRIAELETVKQWLRIAGEIAHDELFESNFMLHFNESLRSLGVFGTCCLYSEWDAQYGQLNFKDHAISTYCIKEDSHGNVDTVILTYTLTARQAIQEFGADKCGKQIVEDASGLTTESEKYEFIHVVRPRTELNPLHKDSKNMPFESVHVDVEGQAVVRESGYEENPYAVARWMKGATEKYGRGQGTESLATIRMLNKMTADYVDLCNRFGKPPLQVLESFEGDVDLRPGAINRVQDVNSIRGIDQQVLGNFPITEKALEAQRQLVHQAFFRDIFVQLADISNRRTAFEIQQRLQEGLRRLASPVSRLQSELLNPIIMRSVLLLIRNGRIPMPPPELQGQSFGVEYMGQLALALRDQQARGFQQWAGFIGSVSQVDPSAVDLISWDRALPRMGDAFGVNSADMATPEEVAAKRQARAAQAQAQMAMAAAQTAGKTYKDGTKAPEEGSPAAALMGANSQ